VGGYGGRPPAPFVLALFIDTDVRRASARSPAGGDRPVRPPAGGGSGALPPRGDAGAPLSLLGVVAAPLPPLLGGGRRQRSRLRHRPQALRWSRGNGGANWAATAAAAMSRPLLLPSPSTSTLLRLRRPSAAGGARHARHPCRRFGERRLRGVDGTAGELVGRPVLRRGAAAAAATAAKGDGKRLGGPEAEVPCGGGATAFPGQSLHSRVGPPLAATGERPGVFGGGGGAAARRGGCALRRWPSRRTDIVGQCVRSFWRCDVGVGVGGAMRGWMRERHWGCVWDGSASRFRARTELSDACNSQGRGGARYGHRSGEEGRQEARSCHLWTLCMYYCRHFPHEVQSPA